MLFNSIEFLLFLPAVWTLYWLFGNRLRMQNGLVVAASYVFYGWWDWRFLTLIAFTSGWSYLVGLIELRRWERPASRTLLVVSLAVNLGILGYFKYFGFFAEQAAELLKLFGFRADLPELRILLPVGISFYTFQALSYTIDVFRRRIEPTKDPLAFFAFISFFPQLVAGPIERATNLLPQFLSPRRFDPAAAVLGCRQMLWGFFKKMVVADNCAVLANGLLDGSATVDGASVALGVFFFALQIYGDFSGYSDIAIGCSRLFGINLMRNFAFPYFSRDIAEFWRRWHISLTTWFRDYIYIPLGGSRCSRGRWIRNTFVVFLVSGLWHGANWTFVVWGLYHAVLFLPLLLRRTNRDRLETVAADRALPTLRELASMTLTFFLATIGWAVFRAPDMSTCCRWFATAFGLSSWHGVPELPQEFGVALVSCAALAAVEWFNRREQFGCARLPVRRWLRWTCYYALIAAIVLWSPGSQSFVYFQF